MAKVDLAIKKYRQEGDLAHEYNALRNLLSEENEIVEFRTDELDIDLNNPLNIECQPSYDGTVNLIINDDKNPPRIINTRFSKIEDNRYKIINRNQLDQTNLYKIGKIDQQTRLFRNINYIPKIQLLDVLNIGQLKGGNYTFYIKFADNDYNKTDVVAESGQVSIFKGYVNKIKTISGTIFDERTDKAIVLKIENVDTSFSKIYVYYTRETCDQNGVRITKAGMFTQPYEIKGRTSTITINGFEEEEELTPEEINIQYNIVTAAKTQAQVQNMLFFGNVQSTILNVKDLQNISYFITVTLKQEANSIGWIKPDTYERKSTDDLDQVEYYSPNNIYYNLGYWPDEMYRLGVVYIMNDDSLTPVFNLRGHNFSALNDSNFIYNESGNLELTSLFKDQEKTEMNYLERDDFINGSKFLDNTFGVFQNPSVNVINYTGGGSVNPLYYQIQLCDDVINALKNLKVKGLFFVRQKRIPTILCQGLSVGVDRASYIPMPYYNNKYIAESFINSSQELVNNFDSRIINTDKKQCSGLLCVDVNVNPQLQSNFDGSEFILKQTASNGVLLKGKRNFHIITQNGTEDSRKQIQASIVYIAPETPMKYVNGFQYSTKCGVAEDVSKFAFFSERNMKADNQKLLRGVYCGFLGLNVPVKDNILYNIKVPNYSSTFVKDYFSIRGKDNAPFYAISDRYSLEEIEVSNSINCFRGDCYSNTVTIRLNRNFVDSEVPTNDIIVDSKTWKNNYKGYNMMKDSPADEDKEAKDKEFGYFTDINRADVNTVPLGMWITYKCLSNYNLGLRSIDTSYTDEYALMGTPRGFYPNREMSVVAANKVNESALLNDGYNATVSQKRNFIVDNVPYIKELFDNRIMFSNVQREDDFQNAYRIFQGLSFKDIDRQYGAIVKFISYGVNIFCVFEHGLAIIPINEKALIQTATNQSIHMYGAGVIQNQVSLISPDFGSIWPESIIRTPVGIYGVDTYAKKIWRYSDKGLETISDMKIQRFLNARIKLSEMDKYPIIALKNVKTHYNNYKGDVMFTFYNENSDETWNICYNERMNKWITRYSWTPLYSENINNIFYSLDQDRAKILGHIYNNKNCAFGIHTSLNEWNTSVNSFTTELTTEGYTLPQKYDYIIDSIESSYLVDSKERKLLIVPVNSASLVGAQYDEKTNTTVIKLLVTYYSDGDTITRTYSGIDPSTEEEVPVLIFNRTVSNGSFTYSLTCPSYSNLASICSAFNIDIPVYFRLNMTVNMYITPTSVSSYNDIIGIVLDNQALKLVNNAKYVEQRNKFLRNGFYVHGKAGIFNELKYRDESFDNEILPTKWYERQEPFEFEFVVNDEVGLHKIFDNLVIISNNVQPNEIEYEIVGDVYNFNKTGIFRNQEFNENLWSTTYSKPKFRTDLKPPRFREISSESDRSSHRKYQSSQELLNCRVEWDDVINSYSIVLNQKCKNFIDYGRRLGNIQYKEDSWYVTIDPILYRESFRINDTDEVKPSSSKNTHKIKEVRVRDKFVKIRVKYTGEDIVIITALKTLLTPSYS